MHQLDAGLPDAFRVGEVVDRTAHAELGYVHVDLKYLPDFVNTGPALRAARFGTDRLAHASPAAVFRSFVRRDLCSTGSTLGCGVRGQCCVRG